MKKKIDGLSRAVGILDKLTQKERHKLFEALSKIDPKLTEKIKEQIITLEDLKFLDKDMFSKVLRRINLPDLGLSLRISSPELLNFIYSNVSKNNQEEINQSFKGPLKPLNVVLEAYGRILKVFREMVEKGDIYINKEEPLV
jgi:flagellar motor switch protein FliG